MTDSPKKPADQDDDLHKKFREALEKKKTHRDDHAEGVRHTGVGEAHNDHHQRQFRRKSGSN
ncbi:MAG: hypothetical protein GEU96_10045 [Propionibacteriales bacterium]|nr:hypothetical protein [Propionibacteriales bacterium]